MLGIQKRIAVFLCRTVLFFIAAYDFIEKSFDTAAISQKSFFLGS